VLGGPRPDGAVAHGSDDEDVLKDDFEDDPFEGANDHPFDMAQVIHLM